jgi:hypothetical protein
MAQPYERKVRNQKTKRITKGSINRTTKLTKKSKLISVLPVDEIMHHIRTCNIKKITCADILKGLRIIYADIKTINEYQNSIDALRKLKDKSESRPNVTFSRILNNFPFVTKIPNIVSEEDVRIVEEFMKRNSTFGTVGDNRQYYFSESYLLDFGKPNKENDFCLSSIFQKGPNSPTDVIDKIIKKVCSGIVSELKRNNIIIGANDDINDNINNNDKNLERQINVYLNYGSNDIDKKNNNNKNLEHVRWHQDCDTDAKKVPSYSIVVLLNEKKWSGGDFYCQYIGKKNPYQRGNFNAPIIKISPEYRAGILLRNNNTRHMVDKIVFDNDSVRRSVLVIQLFDKVYSYDQ